MAPHLTAGYTTGFYCDHCVQLAEYEVTSLEDNEPTEPEQYTEHTILVCAGCVPTAVASALRWHGDNEPSVDRFEQPAVQVLAIAS